MVREAGLRSGERGLVLFRYAPPVSLGCASPQRLLIGIPLTVGFCTLRGVIPVWLRLASGSVAGLFGLIGQAVMLVFVLGLWRAGALQSSETAIGERNAREALPEQVEQ